MDVLKSRLSSIQIVRGPGITTGFPRLDAKIGGWENGDLNLIAGRSSMGKTAIALDMAMAAAETCKVGFFSLEMSKDSLITRMIANKQNTTYQSLIKGEVQPNEKVMEYLSSLQLYVDDRCGVTSSAIVDTLQESTPVLDIVFIDFLQLVKPPIKIRARYEEIDKITEHLKNIAKVKNIPLVVTCQLNRAVEQRTNHEPRLSDLRESGGIEQACDKIIMLYRPAYYFSYEQNQKVEDDSEAWCLIAKNRNGVTGRIPLIWEGNSMTFKSCKGVVDAEF